MNMLRISLLAAVIIAAVAPARADHRADMEKFMADDLERWNAHDASAITKQFYRLDGNHPWSTEAGMRAEFNRLESQGYTVSDIHGIVGCSLGADIGQVELNFTRRTRDGGFMPPKDRTSLYKLRKFEDGWRVTGMSTLPPGTHMECPST
jgi:hypothetical protein